MPATKNLNIRISPERKQALQELATAFGESISEFVVNSVLMRVQHESKVTPQEDPFVRSMRLAAKEKVKLTEDEWASVEASRSGNKNARLTVAQARKRIKAEIKKARA